jgi:hypothetical protein
MVGCGRSESKGRLQATKSESVEVERREVLQPRQRCCHNDRLNHAGLTVALYSPMWTTTGQNCCNLREHQASQRDQRWIAPLQGRVDIVELRFKQTQISIGCCQSTLVSVGSGGVRFRHGPYDLRRGVIPDPGPGTQKRDCAASKCSFQLSRKALATSYLMPVPSSTCRATPSRTLLYIDYLSRENANETGF